MKSYTNVFYNAIDGKEVFKEESLETHPKGHMIEGDDGAIYYVVDEMVPKKGVDIGVYPVLPEQFSEPNSIHRIAEYLNNLELAGIAILYEPKNRYPLSNDLLIGCTKIVLAKRTTH